MFVPPGRVKVLPVDHGSSLTGPRSVKSRLPYAPVKSAVIRFNTEAGKSRVIGLVGWRCRAANLAKGTAG